MPTVNRKPTKRALRSFKAGRLYRGVKLQPTSGRTRFSLDQIRKAVEAAVVKNADALAGKP
jgi:hypothetical protein